MENIGCFPKLRHKKMLIFLGAPRPIKSNIKVFKSLHESIENRDFFQGKKFKTLFNDRSVHKQVDSFTGVNL